MLEKERPQGALGMMLVNQLPSGQKRFGNWRMILVKAPMRMREMALRLAGGRRGLKVMVLLRNTPRGTVMSSFSASKTLPSWVKTRAGVRACSMR